MSPTTNRALIAAAVTAIVVSLVFGTPEILTLAIMFLIPFVVIFSVLFILFRLPSVAALPLARQRLVTSLVAVSTGVGVGLLPRAFSFFTR